MERRYFWGMLGVFTLQTVALAAAAVLAIWDHAQLSEQAGTASIEVRDDRNDGAGRLTRTPAYAGVVPSSERGEAVVERSLLPVPEKGSTAGRPIAAQSITRAIPAETSPAALSRGPNTDPRRHEAGSRAARITPERAAGPTEGSPGRSLPPGETRTPGVTTVAEPAPAGGVMILQPGGPGEPPAGNEDPAPANSEEPERDTGSNGGGRGVDETTAVPPDVPGSDIPRLTMVPAHDALSPGETLLVEVVLSDAREITSVPFHVSFDPEVLEFVSAKPGPVFDDPARRPLLLANVNARRPGDLSVGLALLEQSGTYSGSGSLVTLEFRAIDRGESPLLFERASVRGPTSAPLPARIEGSFVLVN